MQTQVLFEHPLNEKMRTWLRIEFLIQQLTVNLPIVDHAGALHFFRNVSELLDVFERGESIAIEPKGFGGTDFRPVFKWVEEEGITPSCLVYLTDMAGTFPTHGPDYPVLWGDTEGYAPPPFGEHVRIRCD